MRASSYVSLIIVQSALQMCQWIIITHIQNGHVVWKMWKYVCASYT